MQNLESSFSEIVTNLVTETRLEDYIASCLYQHPATIDAAKQITALISDEQIDSDALSLLNHFTGKYLISLHVAYEEQIKNLKNTSNEEENEDETSEKSLEFSLEEIINLNLHRAEQGVEQQQLAQLEVDRRYKQDARQRHPPQPPNFGQATIEREEY
ncbi:hypothetical protein PMKS-003398 [Pichia membranifaciens]|uniref:Uncharacterized protein n=1 Tax=Pichia membranifaciens TaxID=4926 RepID=A0A1Q2YK22_9ASCO|nr:hypothetical protein PMKS-003398 [Pichia membranifaciens]